MYECHGQPEQPNLFPEVPQPAPYAEAGTSAELIQEPPASADSPADGMILPFTELPAEHNATPEEPAADDTAAEATPRGYPYKQYHFTVDDPNLPVDKLSAETLKHWRQRQDTPMPHETPVTDEEWAAIQGMQQKVIDLGDKLGVDVRGRMLGREAHHYFDTYEAYNAAMQTTGDEDRAEFGTEYTASGIVCTRDNDDDPTWKNHKLIHETLHSAAVHKVHMRPQEDGGTHSDVKVGYQDASTSLNETVTDLLTHAVLQELGDDDAEGYYPDCLLANSIIHKVAEHQGMDPADLAKQIGRGLFTGDQTALFYLDDTLGKEQVRAYLSGDHENLQDVIKAAQALDFDDVVAELQRLDSQHPENAPVLLSFFR
ncbi:MAG TPA: hypothetical protein VHT70_02075 [Candidatus Saccharimonadales bacterium]|nr:hypothetical protein [Candidatus Saccharimonadales bacterium]